jgi:DNA polymerase delta subunit 1
MVSFQVVAWYGEDTDSEYVIHIFGRTEDGKSVHVETPFEPYFFVKVPPDRSPKALIQEIQPYSSAVIRRKDLWGFRNQEEYTFLKLGFRTLAEMKECRPRGLKVYEKNLDPVLRFMHRSEIKSTGWVQVPESAGPGHDSSCDIDVCVADWRTLKPVDRDDIAPLRIASLDIESYSESGAFPNAFKDKDVCFQVAVTTKEFGHNEYFDRKCFCVKQTSGSECESFDTEREMLERLGRYLRELDPDIVTGWNIFGFDLEYLYTRAVVTGAGPDAHMWGRLRGIPNELVVKHLASNALGSNDLKMVPMLGRYVFDMFHDIKREHKLESYSLNNVSKEFLKDQKIDMPIKEMFTRFKGGDPNLLGEVADYCIKDTELPHRISEKLCLIQNLIEMAKATWVPLSYLSERGQQIKVFSQLARKARELGFMIPTMYSKATGDEKYQGATVLDAQTGAYYGPITALDFASLYPSIMRAHNLCYSSLVVDPRFANIPGVIYEQYGPYRFAQGTPSLLPAILNELAAFRKKAKKLMAQAEGTPMEAVYNGQQLAYKISMNSIYGFTGASKGMLPCVAIASTVTMRGRQMIEETKNYVEEHFPGAKVRYGDSVMPGTKVRILDPMGLEQRIHIERLAKSWEPYPGFMKDGTHKEKYEVIDEVKSWTHMGWMPIRRVIRHKCQKKIYRVTSPYGTVDVTADHSLLDTHLNLIKPNEIEHSTDLLHCDDAVLTAQPNSVELIHESWDGYVYDLETDAGTFQAGEGFLIVKNTDSVMVEFDVQGRKGQDAIDYSWEQGELASEQCSKLFKAPNDLELEKVYCPYFLYSKKRYAAKMYEGKSNKDGTPVLKEDGTRLVAFKKIDVKGLQVVRRDTCMYVRGVLKQLLNLVLNSEDPRPAIEYARDSAKRLLKGKVDPKELTMSKQLGADYKTRVPHVEVRDKIRKREPGSEPQNGDRVAFLITKVPGLLCDKAEDPSWVTDKKIPLDYVYYFEHQLVKPVCDLLEPLVGANPFQTIFKSVDYLTTPPISNYFIRKSS